MNRLARRAVGTVLGVALLVCVLAEVQDRAMAQSAAPAAPAPAAPAAIPPEARTTATPETFRPQIESFITGHLARLRSGDARAVASSRDALAAEVTGAATTSTYKDVYAEALARLLLPMAEDADVRVRVLAGVVATRVATRVDNARLQPVAVRLLQDENWGVVLWGMRSARGVLDYRARLPGGLEGQPLPGAVAEAAVRHAARGEIIREATEALQLDPLRLQRLPSATVQALVPHVDRITAARIALYRDGMPNDFDADRALVTFYSNAAFAPMPGPQRAQAVQKVIDLLGWTIRHGAAAAPAEYRPVGIHAVRLGRSLVVMSLVINRPESPGGRAVVEAAAFFRESSDTIPPSADALSAALDRLVGALRALPDYREIRAPG